MYLLRPFDIVRQKHRTDNYIDVKKTGRRVAGFFKRFQFFPSLFRPFISPCLNNFFHFSKFKVIKESCRISFSFDKLSNVCGVSQSCRAEVNLIHSCPLGKLGLIMRKDTKGGENCVIGTAYRDENSSNTITKD